MKARMNLRASARTGVTVREGTLDSGKPWKVREVEVLDADYNKFSVRVHDSIPSLAVGTVYDFVVEVEVARGAYARVEAVAATPVKSA